MVITGASSGIGLETSLAFAHEGCRLVLAARRADALEKAVESCQALGAEAFAIPTDITRQDDVEQLVRETLSKWSRIDVWVNNAGTTMFSHLDEGEFALHRQVIETNLIGPMYAARVILPVLRSQRAGIVINVGSVLSKVAQPFVPSYVISKFGLRGLSEALRAEVADFPDVHICTIFPYAIDTPHFESGANAISREAHPMPPTQSPERVAAAIVDLASRPRREVHVPRYIVLGIALHKLFPRTTERLLRQALDTFHFGDRQAPTSGNVVRPTAQPGRVHGVRKPLTSNFAFALWAIGELARMLISSTRRILGQ